MPSSKQTGPEHYDDPMGLDDPAPEAPKITATVTGLSEEDDAVRLVALRFDKLIGFCRNCEGYWRTPEEDGEPRRSDCPVCWRPLYLVGTPPARHKR